ncbi:MAG: tRNA (N6-threonylcarbamoyladenosine(37)-N6)-methyltransferase TrmO [Paludibacteraceae bacterium]|nr:tRNA (N6-threonylcarbamoyladenosine(37)-N6)-methyltransferase TrmO [Paludibacteraceae bacterium]
MNLSVIARARNGFSSKFGVPRQVSSSSSLETRIVFEPAFRVREALRGIEECSHLWLIWGFDQVPQPAEEGFGAQGWSPTVRPPRLGGNKRVGVFATRSPYRPNRLGLTSVRLLRVEETAREGLVLVVSGADMQDGTPVFDIKPYLRYADSHPAANDGIMTHRPPHALRVEWGTDARPADDSLREALTEIIAQDPRPAYQNSPSRRYHFDYDGYAVTFEVGDGTATVVGVDKKV